MNSLFATVITVLSTVYCAPVGPDFNNIQYAHDLNLTYANGTLNGLGVIDTYTDVDPQMDSSLKEAINRALPDYFATTDSSSTTPMSTDLSSSTMSSSSSSPRAKRAVSDATSTTPSSSDFSSSSYSPQQADAVVSTTQPYGTDEEFYARTDLVHFQVNIDQLGEGSGMGQ
uniref:Uncharacterized protein n=1 Tax=Caenorhabditis japonica TaxID=281687 RepID=A0A8R1E7A0_CAEJA